MVVEMMVERTLRIVFTDGDIACTDPDDEFERLHTLLNEKLRGDPGSVEINVADEKILIITRGGKEIHNSE